MGQFKYCKDCNKEINSNVNRCKICLDIHFYGSIEKATEIAKKNFEYIGLNVEKSKNN